MPNFLPKADPVAITTASYFSLSWATLISLPISTLAKRRKLGSAAIFSKVLETVLIFG